MIRRPPRSTLDRSSAASDVYKRQIFGAELDIGAQAARVLHHVADRLQHLVARHAQLILHVDVAGRQEGVDAVSYTHLRAHETVLDLVCRLLLEKKK